MSTTISAEGLSARERLLAAANELFYEEGINSVGIDRIIERAGVAKATLYSTFGSKDELMRAYLARRHDSRRERYETKLQRFKTPREKLLGVFDIMGEFFAEPTFRGCPFVNASAETRSGDAVAEVVGEARSWVRGMFADLARDAGVRKPDALAQQLQLLYDGATVGAELDHTVKTAATAKRVAEALLDLALGA